MPRYVVERTFSEGLRIPVDDGAAELCRGVVERNAEDGVTLTTRELEVLPLLVEGVRHREIATRLVVSEKTVDHHVSAILRKIGVRNRSEAAAEASRLGLTQPAGWASGN
jgi:DNA-binding NarL/FixJ family response regulator